MELSSKTGNGCFWLGRDNGKYLVKVEDGIDYDPSAAPMSFASARIAYDFCLEQHDQSSGMESHAYWNVCDALEEYVYAEEQEMAA
jgi:hypothetical protein